MENQERDFGPATFPSNWTLSSDDLGAENAHQGFEGLSAYPQEWSLATILESISKATDVLSQATSQNTAKGDFPIALLDQTENATTVSSPRTFERSWTLPPRASTDRHMPPRAASGALVHDLARHPGLESASLNGVIGAVPRHLVPHAQVSPSSDLGQYSHSLGAHAVPGNFRPQGYSNTGISQQSNQGQTTAVGAVSSSMPVKSDQSPGSWNYYSYQPPKPAGFIPTNTSPQSALQGNSASLQQYRPADFFSNHTSPQSALQSSSASLNPYRLPRPAGFSSNDTSPQSVLQSSSASLNPYRPSQPAGFLSNHTSPQSVLQSSSTSLNPYRPSQPAGFISTNASQQSLLEGNPASLQPYRPQQPAGFALDNTNSPTTFHTQDGQVQLPPIQAEHGYTTTNSLPTDLLRRNVSVPLAPIEIPTQTNPWRDPREQSYRPPAPPLTATAPWHSAFAENGIPWRSLS